MVHLLVFDKLKIVSLNARGLRDHVKRRKIYRYCKLHCKADIVFLQETHCEKNVEKLWSNEYGNKIYFSNGTSNSKGVGIAMNKKVVNNVDSVIRDMEGRYILLKCTFEGSSYCLGNIYAPNNDDYQWFEEVFELIHEMDCVHVILGGGL